MQFQIIEQLDIQKGEELEHTPTYMPAVLVNLANNFQLRSSKKERLSQAVILGLPFLAKVLERHKLYLIEHPAASTTRLNFNRVAEIAKRDPHLLTQDPIIDGEGNVSIVKV